MGAGPQHVVNITPHTYSSTASIDWLRWNDPTNIEKQLPDRIKEAVEAVIDLQPTALWNAILELIPPYVNTPEKDALYQEIISDIYKNEDQTLEDTIRELREYQFALLFSTEDYPGYNTQYQVRPTLPSNSDTGRQITRRIVASAPTFTYPADDEVNRPISCMYYPLDEHTAQDKEIAAGVYEYINRPDPERPPIRVKYPQKSRHKAILECFLQRYKHVERYYRTGFTVPLNDETVFWKPLDSLKIASDVYYTGSEITGIILETEHVYPDSGPMLVHIKAKLFPPGLTIFP